MKINKNKIKIAKIITAVIILAIFILFLVRLALPSQIDDISPEIPCDSNYIAKSNILWIIPKFNNVSIAENKTWCNYVLSLNKTLGLHGVYHSHKEFKKNISQEYLEEGINIFEKCFGFKPSLFKPPQLRVSKENRVLVNCYNLTIKTMFNQVFHKVYHCKDTGVFSNKFLDFF